MPTEQKLYAFAHLDGGWVPCGQLTLTEEHSRLLASSFAYGLKYLERPGALEIDPVALALHDRDSVRGRVLYPAGGLAFFGGIRDAAPEAWGRKVIEAKLKVAAGSLPESMYMLHAGGQRAGALAIRRSLDTAATIGPNNWNNLEHLAQGAEKIDAGLPVPESLEAIFSMGTALGGARPKASVRDAQGVLWLAKFGSRMDSLDVPAVEAATLKMAADAGLNVPPVKWVTLDARSIMVIRRFDRYWSRAGADPRQELPDDLYGNLPAPNLIEKRLAFISAPTLLAGSDAESPSRSYGRIAQAIRRHCHPDVIRSDNRELFARMIFNIFVSNDDDHLRNHGFIWDPRLAGWRLSPMYDVVPHPSAVLRRQLSLDVGPEGRAATLDNAFAAREWFTLTSQDAADTIAAVWAAVRDWQAHFDRYGVPAGQVAMVESAFRHIDDISSEAMRNKLP